jgi:hypothetical protein
MTDGQSASLSWCQAASGDQHHIFVMTVAGLFMWGTLSEERMGLLFTLATGACQHGCIYHGQNQ